jgi:hypothetical protein
MVSEHCGDIGNASITADCIVQLKTGVGFKSRFFHTRRDIKNSHFGNWWRERTQVGNKNDKK